MVADTRILVFDKEGEFLREFGGMAGGKEEKGAGGKGAGGGKEEKGARGRYCGLSMDREGRVLAARAEKGKAYVQVGEGSLILTDSG